MRGGDDAARLTGAITGGDDAARLTGAITDHSVRQRVV